MSTRWTWLQRVLPKDRRWRLIITAGAALVLLVVTLVSWPMSEPTVELTGVASGFSFTLDEDTPSSLFPGMPLATLRAAGLDRLVVEGHREIVTSYLVAGAGSDVHLLSPLAGLPGSAVRLHRTAPGVLTVSLERGAPLTVSVAKPDEVMADGDLEDLPPAPTLIELLPAASEPLELELEMAPAAPADANREVALAERVSIRSLRFEETPVNHQDPVLTRTVGTVHQASLSFPELQDTARSIGRGARLHLDRAEGQLEYWLNEEGHLAFRYQGRVAEVGVRAGVAEQDGDLIPSLLEALHDERQAGLVITSVLFLITLSITLLQLRKLL